MMYAERPKDRSPSASKPPIFTPVPVTVSKRPLNLKALSRWKARLRKRDAQRLDAAKTPAERKKVAAALQKANSLVIISKADLKVARASLKMAAAKAAKSSGETRAALPV